MAYFSGVLHIDPYVVRFFGLHIAVCCILAMPFILWLLGKGNTVQESRVYEA